MLQVTCTWLTDTITVYRNSLQTVPYITSLGVVGTENGQFKIPLGVAIDGHSGNVYVV